MKVLRYICLMLIFILTGAACASLNTNKVLLPDDLIYRNRLLLIFTPRQGLPIYQREEEKLVNNVEGLASRDIQVYRLFPRKGLNPENRKLNSAQVFSLRNKYEVGEDQFLNIVVDKDGEAKLRKEGYLSPQSLFQFIDSLYVNDSIFVK
ncbi:DUF4174 domain-containing protein [Rhodocytophaga aerolata]|uniref:DUF4174 domain-containing protein n=1 Tax=Rhodocytophaga aerolata TaxID=455078 RepID=A0ABT8RF47_9BACT|nr:DUF4174 domain-containing protein [Rhodocytophaga aerolata]MDO1450690.1 DUF4174 domain-containing protein [Rhodocytophaga aerolata]